ncbi:unnamed protein product, partial [Rhizoctonia solani]
MALNARPKRAKKDTEKIAPFCAEVKKQKASHISRNDSKDEDEESDLPDTYEVGRGTSGQPSRCEALIQRLQDHGEFDVSGMDDSELETVWKDVKNSKQRKKCKLFGKASKVVDNAPARPAISPKKKRGRSPSPKSTSNKCLRAEVDTYKQPKSNGKGMLPTVAQGAQKAVETPLFRLPYKTVQLVECHLLLVNYFLENHNLFLVIKKKWEMAVREKGEKLKCFPVDDRHFKAVKLRIQAFCGRLHDLITKAGPSILIAYNMQGLSQGSPKAIAAIDSKLPTCKGSPKARPRPLRLSTPNCRTIYISRYRPPGSKKGFGWFQHDFILEAVYHVLCVGRSPIAGEYPELFREFPTRLVTLICAICFERAGFRESAPAVKVTKFDTLTVEDFAEDEPTEEERLLLGLTSRSTTTTTTTSHIRARSPQPTSRAGSPPPTSPVRAGSPQPTSPVRTCTHSPPPISRARSPLPTSRVRVRARSPLPTSPGVVQELKSDAPWDDDSLDWERTHDYANNPAPASLGLTDHHNF